MSGRHLRRGRSSSLRRPLGLLAVLALGAALGAGGSLLLEEHPDDGAGDGPTTGSAALVPDPGPITIALAGDVTFGDALADRLGATPGDFVGPIATVLREADVAVVNLDAPVVDEPPPGAAPPAILDALARAGIDVVSASNDRSMQLGVERLLGRSGDGAVIGVGADEDEAYAPFVRDIGGHRVAVIAATQLLEPGRIATDTAGPSRPGVASAKRVDRLVAEVEAVRADADVVVVYLHWGTEGETCPSVGQQELAAALVAAGADVVAGPGAGSVQGAGRAGGAVVAYGLGTLLADAPADPETGVLLVRVHRDEVLGLEWLPARIGPGGVPEPLAGADAATAVADWKARRGCTDLTPDPTD